MLRVVTTTGPSTNHYWSKYPLILVVYNRGRLSCDGAGSPLALVGISPRREVDDSKYGKFVSPPWEHSLPHAGEKCLLPLGGEVTSASFPYYVIGEGKVDLYWLLGEAI